MKTIKEHLESLDEPYRTQALENVDEEDIDDDYQDIRTALASAFLWEESPEGVEYWSLLHDSLDTNLPITPAQEPDELLDRLRQVYLVDQSLREPKSTEEEILTLWDDVNKYLAK